MEKHGVVPDLIPAAPKETIEIKYGDVSLNLGDELTPTQVKDPPTTLKWTAEPGALYTLLFTDIDIPPQYNAKEFQHWLVVNIPGNDISKGNTIFDYIGSGPPQGTGLHRYVFVIYKQPKKIAESEISQYQDLSKDDRKKFTHNEFVVKHKLKSPVAANYYRAQYDDYVPILHASFSKKWKA